MSDYIDRNELIKHIKDLPTWWGDGSGVYAFYPVEVMLSIESAPVADVQEIKHGEWKSFDSEDTLYGSYYCSACAHGQDIGMIIPLTTEFKYCPNCGAKMDGKEVEGE